MAAATATALLLFLSNITPIVAQTICTNTCTASDGFTTLASNGFCDDGGVGAEYIQESTCAGGTDCADCGPRVALCTNTCIYPSDNDCDDGGNGAVFPFCTYGTDCYDCGPRFASSGAAPPPSPSPPPDANPRPPPPPPPSPSPPALGTGGWCSNPEYPYYCDVGGCRLPRLKPSLALSALRYRTLLHGTSVNLGSNPRAIGCINCNPDECSNCQEGCGAINTNTAFTCDPAIPTWAYPAGGGVLVVGLIGFLLYRQQRKNQINAFARAQAGATQGNPPVPTAQAVPVQAAQAVAVPAAQPVPAPASHARPIPTLG